MIDDELQVAIYEHTNGHIRITKGRYYYKRMRGHKIIFYVQYKATDNENWSYIMTYEKGNPEPQVFKEVTANNLFKRLCKSLEKGAIIRKI